MNLHKVFRELVSELEIGLSDIYPLFKIGEYRVHQLFYRVDFHITA